jgi:hypothetical protein
MIDLFHDEELPRFVLGRQIRVQKNRGQLTGALNFTTSAII